MNLTTLTPEEEAKARKLHQEYEDETGIGWNFGNNSDYNKWLEKKLFALSATLPVQGELNEHALEFIIHLTGYKREQAIRVYNHWLRNDHEDNVSDMGHILAEHPEHHCHTCGNNNPEWTADNSLFNEVNGSPYGIMCPTCFIKSANEKEVDIIIVQRSLPVQGEGSVHKLKEYFEQQLSLQRSSEIKYTGEEAYFDAVDVCNNTLKNCTIAEEKVSEGEAGLVKVTKTDLELLQRSIRAADPTGLDVLIKDLKKQIDKILSDTTSQQK